MRIGMTGTRKGVTNKQLEVAEELLSNAVIDEFHHGDCVGADEALALLVRKSWPDAIIYRHPPTNPTHRAYAPYTISAPVKDYLDRNKDIVDSSELMFAFPAEFNEKIRSGTWSTIRYARKTGVPLIIIYPDGTLKKEP